MKIGLMWKPNKGQSFLVAAAEAAAHYKTKYGKAPTTCYVRPAEGLPSVVGGMAIVQDSKTPKDCLWLGAE